MPRYTPDELASITGGYWHTSTIVPPFSDFCFDARKISPGACFVALSGGARDGHEFLAQAAQGGAVAALVERPLPVDIAQLVVADSLRALGAVGKAVRETFEHPVIGITGSCGKTSTKEMLRLLLGKTQTLATAGNWNNRIGVPLTLLGLDSQTHQFGVIEAGINQPGEMQLLGEMIRADLTIVTNVGPAHLELLKTVENIASEKARLADQAVVDAPVIFPSDLLKYPSFRKLASRAIVLQSEGDAGPTVSVANLVKCRLRISNAGHYEITLIDGDMGASFVVATTSRGIASNAALAILAARKLGISDSEIRARMQQWLPTGNRGSLVERGEQLFYVDCYNANPASMSDSLSAFTAAIDESLPRAYVLGVMNELGIAAEIAHEAIGRQLKLRPADRAYFVGPHGLADAYLTGAISAGNAPSQLKRAETIEAIKSEVAAFRGALFLKGSRSYQLEQLLPAGMPSA
jgi:UDP-N-acetylmuramoyl-tripeptide--D-alanyl-D-alanine ligase